MTDTRFGRRDPNARGYYGEYGGTFVPDDNGVSLPPRAGSTPRTEKNVGVAELDIDKFPDARTHRNFKYNRFGKVHVYGYGR